MDKQNKLKEKEDKLKADKEKEDAFKKSVDDVILGFDMQKFGIKLDTYLKFVEDILDKWNYKTKEKDTIDHLALSTCKIIDLGCREKELANFSDNLSSVNKSILQKVCYAIHERIGNKQNVYSIKSSKLLSIQNQIISSEGIGSLSKAIFSIQK